MLHWFDSQGAGRVARGARLRLRSTLAAPLCTLAITVALAMVALQGSSSVVAAELSSPELPSPEQPSPEQVGPEESVAGQTATGMAAWRLDRERDGVRIYTRPLANSSFRAVRSTMTVPYRIAELVALVRDTEACAEWAHLCRSSRVIETLSETDVYVYTHNDLPWPISDRDAVAHVTWTVDAETGSVTMDARAVAGRVPEKRGIVRLTNADTSWHFTPLADGQVEVVSEAHVDPGGPLPAWMINRMLLDAPYKTLSNLRRIVESGRYADARFEFLAPRSSAPSVSSP